MVWERVPTLVEWFESFGFEFTIEGKLPEGGSVTVEGSENHPLYPYAIAFGHRYREHLFVSLSERERQSKEVCVGGPLDGRRHRCVCGQNVLCHAGRAEWHVYVINRHRVGVYIGTAASKPKAKSMANDYRTTHFAE